MHKYGDGYVFTVSVRGGGGVSKILVCSECDGKFLGMPCLCTLYLIAGGWGWVSGSDISQLLPVGVGGSGGVVLGAP